MRHEPRGFTLIEVMVALVIGTVVVVMSHAVFRAVADQGRRLEEAREALDREMNARRWLQAAFLSLEVGVDRTVGFAGLDERVGFAAWQRTAEGWFERRDIALECRDQRLVATVTPGEPVTLEEGVEAVAFDYLLEPGEESRWVREWISPVSAPIAVRIRVRRSSERRETGRSDVVDTLLFLVKERG